MADMSNFVIPKPPDNADLNTLQTWAKDLYGFLVNVFQTGVQPPFFSQNQIDQMNGQLSQAGKLVFNNDTGKHMVGEVVAGNLVMKTITTS
jgi:hypothetical protein